MKNAFKSCRAVLCALFILMLLPASAIHAQTALDGFTVPVTAGTVREVKADANGQVMIGGQFTYGATTRRLIRVRPDGSQDTAFSGTFNPPAGSVYVVHPRNNGTYLVGGDFSGSGIPSHFAWLSATGNLFSTYDLALNGQVRAIAQAADHPDSQNFYIGGEFTAVEGANRHRVARLKPDMSFDATFTPPLFDGTVLAVLPLPGGKVLVSGGFLTIPGQPSAGQRVFRLNANGSLDTSFAVTSIPNGIQNINAMARQSDGKILIAGNFTATSGGQTRSDIARLNTDGSLDLTYEPPTITGELVDMAMQPDGRAVIVGTFGVNRLNVDGSLDLGFALLLNPDDTILSVDVQGDGGVLVGGLFTELNSTIDANRVARLSNMGVPDRDFAPPASPPATGDVLAVASQTNGDVIVGGAFTTLAGQPRTYLARLGGATGLLSTSFTPTLNGPVRAIVILPDGKFLAGGDFTLVNGSTRRRLARFEASGALDTSFTAANIPDGAVYAIELAPDGKIYIGGSFTSIGGQPTSYFTRLLATGALDPEFGNTGVDGPVRALAMEWDQWRIYIGGEFNNVDGIERRRIARIWPNGGLNTSFAPPTSGGFVEDLVSLPDGGVVAAGLYSGAYDGLVKLDVNGDLVTPFALLESGWAQSVVRDHDGRIYVGGTFLQVNGTTRLRLARITAAGVLDTTFNAPLISLPGQPTPQVWAMALQGDGRLVIAGTFSSVSGEARSNIARLGNRHGVPDERLVMAAGNELRWVRGNAPADPRAPPALQLSTACCGSASFADVPGTMVLSGAYWSYPNFPVPPGTFWVKARARVGDSNGTGMYETPIQQFQGTAVSDVVFANGFDPLP